MEMKLNLVSDKPTINGRIYSKKILKEALDQKDIPILLDANQGNQHNPINMNEIIGFANLNKFNKDKITFDTQFLTESNKELFKDYELSISGLGEVNKDNQVIDFKLTHLFPTIEE
jgi:hypothetical protein